MNNKCIATLIIASLILVMTASAASAADAVRIGSGIDPAISQNLVTWTRAAGDEVHVYNLVTGQDLKIKTSQAAYSDIDASNGLVVWCQSGKLPRLVIYDLKAAKILGYIPSVEAGTQAAISEGKIVWSSGGQVKIYDVAQRAQSVIGAGYDPDISGNRVAYEAVDATEHDIIIYDLVSHASVTVPHDGDLTDPRISGNEVAFLDENGFVARYDLTTGFYQLVNANSVYGHGDEGEIHSLALDGVLVYNKVQDNVLGDAGVYALDGDRLLYLNDTVTGTQEGSEVGATVDVSSYGSEHYAVWGFVPDVTATKLSNGGIYSCSCTAERTGYLGVFSNQAGARIDIYHNGKLYVSGDGDWGGNLPVGHYLVIISQRGGEALVDAQAVDLTEAGESIDYRNG